MSLSPGDAVRVLMTKWPDRPHSEFTGTYLGADQHGDWVGARAGTTCRRSGNTYAARSDWVTLLTETTWWRAGFYDPTPPTATYVDIATPSAWDGAAVTCVDLDLDVVLQFSGEVLVADEDEFEEHRTTLGYPDDVVARALDAALWVRGALEAGLAPFDGSHLPWLARLRAEVPTP